MTTVPPDWYRDPDPATPSGSLRYWDGRQWTEAVRVPLAGWW